MRHLLELGFVLAISGAAFAQEGRGVGYPTVAAALEALKARDDVKISVRDGWTVVEDRSANTIWSFIPPNHPAHPAVVKRTVVSMSGGIGMQMNALCEATKAACDTLIADFRDLNEKARQSMRPQPKTGGESDHPLATLARSNKDTTWRPTAEQVQSVERQTYAYFSARDAGQLQQAYSLFSARQKQTVPFDKYASNVSDFNAKVGEVRNRKIKKITWYKDPPSAEPGVYAAADFTSQFAKADIHCGYVVWYQRDDSSFALVREEEGFIDKATQSKIKPDELEKVRAQLHC